MADVVNSTYEELNSLIYGETVIWKSLPFCLKINKSSPELSIKFEKFKNFQNFMNQMYFCSFY